MELLLSVYQPALVLFALCVLTLLSRIYSD